MMITSRQLSIRPLKLDQKADNKVGLEWQVIVRILFLLNKIGGRKDYNPQTGYIQNMHTSFYSGRSFASSAPYGTSQEHENPYQEPPKKFKTFIIYG